MHFLSFSFSASAAALRNAAAMVSHKSKYCQWRFSQRPLEESEKSVTL